MGRRQTVFVLGTFYWHHVHLFTEELGPHPGTQALGGELCEAGYSAGVGGGPARKRGRGGSTGESGGGGRCAHRGRHTPGGVPSRTKVPSLDRSGRPPLPLGHGCESNGSFKVWSRKEKKGK